MGYERPIRLTRAQQQAQTRERLLSAAERVLAHHGYNGASIDLISAEAGYSKGAVYSNFASKEDVFLELMSVYMARVLADIEQIVGRDPMDQANPTDAILNWLNSVMVDNDCLLLTTELQLQARRSEAFGKKYYALQLRQSRTLGEMLERHFQANKVALPVEPTELANAMIALVHGIALLIPNPKRGKPNPAGQIARAMLLSMLQK